MAGFGGIYVPPESARVKDDKNPINRMSCDVKT